MTTDTTQKKSWNWRGLIFCHLCIAFLLGSLLWPLTKTVWDFIDVHFFTWINSSLSDNKPLQIFWAFANHKKADWFEDVCFLIFFLIYIRSANGLTKERKTAQFIFCVLYAAFTILVVNHLVFRVLVDVYRTSPSLAIEGSIRLSKELTWLSIKDSSVQCFPADHGTTALLFAAFYSFLSNKKMAFISCLYAAFLCMPRLITGAHWLSDVIVGSGSIVLLFVSWVLCTPLFDKGSSFIEKVIAVCRFRKKNSPVNS